MEKLSLVLSVACKLSAGAECTTVSQTSSERQTPRYSPSLPRMFVNRRDLQDLSRTTLNEAKALLRMRYPDGAYYLAGYAVEGALKAFIAKAILRHDFPERKRVDDSHTHNLEKLMKLV